MNHPLIKSDCRCLCNAYKHEVIHIDSNLINRKRYCTYNTVSGKCDVSLNQAVFGKLCEVFYRNSYCFRAEEDK